MLELLPPAGTPVYFTDIVKWLASLPHKTAELEKFSQALREKFGVKHSFFVSTGRAGLYLILKALSRTSDPRRNEVIVPSYTCYSVPGSIIKAGLKVRICDVNCETLGYDLDKLKKFDFSRVLAITASNLYGIPDDLSQLEKISHDNSIHLIDDAAQSMGAKIQNRYAGTFGTAGLYSLDKGKNITSMQGGIIVSNSDEFSENLKQLLEELPYPDLMTTLTDSVKLLAYSCLIRPRLYWITKFLPFLNLGKTRYSTDYPVTQYSPALGSFAFYLFKRLDTITGIRINNAEMLLNKLSDIPQITLIKGANNTKPAYLRLPLLFQSTSIRNKVMLELQQAGITATGSYPRSIADIPEISELLNPLDLGYLQGRDIAENILTLPTHQYVTNLHMEKVASIIKHVLSR